MNLEVITKEDLQTFRLQLLNDIRNLFLPQENTTKEWLRSSEVRKLMKISPGTLQNLRVTGKLKSTKIGGIHYYQFDQIRKLLDSVNE
jgi:hypothetical protein